MKQSVQNIWRWILFIPLSIIASEIIKYLLNKFDGGIFKFFSPAFGEAISGVISWTCTAIVLMLVAYQIIPAYKKTTMKIYATIWTILTIGWTTYTYILSNEGVVGSFWFPLLLSLGFFAGLWGTFLKLFYLRENVEAH
ncbi:hypothetical protein [Aquipluma nitroreducens]|uniref:hypothetical protein n=1 Tax=Aquipluma nitroreducens TaxID=2010828 RepID=UPI00296F7299|nr:hypothetical protein [Aquipluma nitroreducens]